MFQKSDSTFRPITILDALKKCVDGEIMRRMLRLLHDFDMLQKEQFGFVVNGGIEGPVELIAQMYEDALQYGKELHLIMYDMKSAYDSVPWALLDIMLRRLHLPESLIDRVRHTLAGQKRVMSTAYGTREARELFELLGSLPQGNRDSPGLWDIAFDFVLSYASTVNGEPY